MLITNIKNTARGLYNGFNTHLLIGETNAGSKDISVQITHVDAGGEQFLHSHPEAQCYYLVQGGGLMTIDDEEQQVAAGDAVYIPPDATHGIKNTGSEILVYLTANQAFGLEKEKTIWSEAPAVSRDLGLLGLFLV